jgi:S1-C subfamily serine protease
MVFDRKNGARNLRAFVLALSCMIAGAALAYWGFSQGVKSRSVVYAESPLATASAQVKTAIAGAETTQEAFSYVADAVTPAIVELSVVEKVEQPQSLGSGIIVRDVGKTMYVLTNAHVAGDAVEISATPRRCGSATGLSPSATPWATSSTLPPASSALRSSRLPRAR